VKNLEKVVSKIEKELDEKDQVREVALKSSRAMVRLSGSTLKGMHREEDVKHLLDELRDEASRLSSLVGDHPDLVTAGYVENAFQEYAEVFIVLSLVNEGDVPSPEQLRMDSIAYLLGLGDAVGELRRFCLDSLRKGDFKRANAYLDMMEDIFTSLMRFDYPDALVAIRRKQDVIRSLLEKTRGEVAVATASGRLQARLEEGLKRD